MNGRRLERLKEWKKEEGRNIKGVCSGSYYH